MGLFDALLHPKPEDLSSIAAAGVSDGMLGGFSADTWVQQTTLSHPDLNLGRACGVHPWAAHERLPQQLRALRQALDDGGITALGEIGLDRAVARETFPQQQHALDQQHSLAESHGLPVLLHIVRAHGRALELLGQHPGVTGVVHGFSGAAEVAQAYLRCGLFISFGGMLLNPRARKARQAAQAVPIDRILIETDGPSPTMGPGGLRSVLQALSALRPESLGDLAAATAENARVAYRL